MGHTNQNNEIPVKIQTFYNIKTLGGCGATGDPFIIHGNEKYGSAILDDGIKLFYYVNHILIIWSSNHTEYLLSRQVTWKKRITLHVVCKGHTQ